MSSPAEGAAPAAVILGCAGAEVSAEEGAFFAESDPLGFILFKRNCRDREQVRRLVGALRDSIGRSDAPVLIDQEGGRVARLGPPQWRSRPPARAFGDIAAREGIEQAAALARANARLIAADLMEIGVTVDCLPVLDVPVPGAHDIIGDRAFASDPEIVAVLGGAVCDGLSAGGVMPVVKHMPGHGRAGTDSHVALPVVEASYEALAASDFVPFRRLKDAPWAMTAHVLYRALDPNAPATTSETVIRDVIRGEIGYEGLLISDDIAMQALSGRPGERAAAALAAGCDVVLHCNGNLEEMREVVTGTRRMSEAALRRYRHGVGAIAAVEPADIAGLEQLVERAVAAA